MRNDKLGDFMLAWPATACLKRAHPDNHITVLVPAYTVPMARLCPWVDAIIQDPGDQASRGAQHRLLEILRDSNFDASLTLFSTPRIGWLCWRAGIPLRMAPATKWAQIFHNQRITQRRSRCERPEYQYNIELAQALAEQFHQKTPAVRPPYWPLAKEAFKQQRRRLAAELNLDPHGLYAYLHVGSGGSAANLTPQQYSALAQRISEGTNTAIQWVLTAGPGEEKVAHKVATALTDAGANAVVMMPRNGLADFALSLAAADLFISGSTGPLHIAGCLNRPTAGFYSNRRSATALRWQTCNEAGRRIAFGPPTDNGESMDMSRIDIGSAARRIVEWWPTVVGRYTGAEYDNQYDRQVS